MREEDDNTSGTCELPLYKRKLLKKRNTLFLMQLSETPKHCTTQKKKYKKKEKALLNQSFEDDWHITDDWK